MACSSGIFSNLYLNVVILLLFPWFVCILSPMHGTVLCVGTIYHAGKLIVRMLNSLCYRATIEKPH